MMTSLGGDSSLIIPRNGQWRIYSLET